MRSKFSDIVEKGRMTHGQLASSTDDTWGMFFLTHPRSGIRLKVMIGDGKGWDHVSVSSKKSTPKWNDMCWVNSLFFESDECVIQYHPPETNYVNFHPHCLHLWKPQGTPIPMPPIECV